MNKPAPIKQPLDSAADESYVGYRSRNVLMREAMGIQLGSAQPAYKSPRISTGLCLGPARRLMAYGVLLGTAVVPGIGLQPSNQCDRDLEKGKRELQNPAAVLTEQTDRALESIELVWEAGALRRAG